MSTAKTVKLKTLNPQWVSHGGDGVLRPDEHGHLRAVPYREGVGIIFDCPCGCENPCYVEFENPIGGGPPQKGWKRLGQTFENLSLLPSIHRNAFDDSCGWHGFVTDGEVRTV